MSRWILIGSIIGVINSIILIIYSVTTSKGNLKANKLFALVILCISLRVLQSILKVFFGNSWDLFHAIGISGFVAIGPAYYFFIKTYVNKKFVFNRKHLLHFVPSALILSFVSIIQFFKSYDLIWHVFNRMVLFQYIFYVVLGMHYYIFKIVSKNGIKKQLNLFSTLILSIWLVYLINDVSGIPYISGAILYSILIYISLIIVLNKGYIVNHVNIKYEKTGLKSNEEMRILTEFETLMNKDKVFKNGQISLNKLAKTINTNTHALSQVINANKNKSYNELIRIYRITEAKELLEKNTDSKISDIAYEVGYNSLSSFNKAFKLVSGLTPSKYKNEISN